MEKQIRHNRAIMIIILMISLISSWFLMNYLVGQVSKTADKESLSHILENTEQLHYGFHNRIEDTWAIMEIESQSLSELASAPERDVLRAISLLQEKTEASHVYLIARDGQYLEGSGNTGQWQLDAAMLPLLRGRSFSAACVRKIPAAIFWILPFC